MRELASHIIAVANNVGLPITNLQLHKIMFFIFGLIVKERGIDDEFVRKTYDLKFRRWSTGFVIEEIYFDYHHFGGRPIKDSSAKLSDKFNKYNDKIVHLMKVDPFKLVELNHRLPSWANYREQIYERLYIPPYTLEEYEKDFCKKFTKTAWL